MQFTKERMLQCIFFHQGVLKPTLLNSEDKLGPCTFNNLCEENSQFQGL